MAVPFVTEPEPAYGVVTQAGPGLRRVVARNANKFTYWGTGTYIVGEGRVAVVDPGPDDEEHVAAVLGAVAGETVEALLVTHTHRDHSPATRAVAEATGAPSYGYGPHPVADGGGDAGAVGGADGGSGGGRDEEPGDMAFVPDHAVRHGDVIEGDGWSFECLHTPGHISNHVAYAWREAAGVFTGDHVMGWSTTVIPPPDGDMADYMDSLRLLAQRPDDGAYWPTHGPPVTNPHGYVAALIAHRLEREQQILDLLASGPCSIGDMVQVMYADVAAELHEAAGRSVLAHLIAMVADGRVAGDGTSGGEVVYRRDG